MNKSLLKTRYHGNRKPITEGRARDTFRPAGKYEQGRCKQTFQIAALIRKSSNKLGFGAIQTHASQAQEGALNRQEAEENVTQRASGSFRVMLDPRLAPPPDPAGVITW